MKAFVGFLTLIMVVSCSHEPKLKQKSHADLTELVMNHSLLNAALTSAAEAAPNCVQPFESNMPKSVFKRLMQLIEEEFNYQQMHKSIKQRILTNSHKDGVLSFAEELDGKIWGKFLKGVQTASTKGEEKYSELFQSLDDSTFDLTTKRAQLVAQITDYAFMVNLVNISNSQVLKMVKADSIRPINAKQKNILKWLDVELKTFNDAHIKALFTNMYLTTEDFTEAELVKLLKIRSHSVLRLGKEALEQEISGRYNNFFKRMKQFSVDRNKKNKQVKK